MRLLNMKAIYGLLSYLLCSTYAAPLMRQLVDMSYGFGESTLYHPSVKKFNMDVVLNATVEGGYWVQHEEYSSSTHIGTHMDAPAHFAKGGLTVDQIPLTTLIGPAAVVDITERARNNPDAEAVAQDLLDWESATGHSLNGTIVLLRSGWGKRWNNRTAFLGSDTNDSAQFHWPGFTSEAMQWLVDNRDIKGYGTECISLDIGIVPEFRLHRVLLERGIFGLENVANVDKIPIWGATLYVMPMKMEGGSGGPTRIFASYPEVIFEAPLRTQNQESPLDA